MWVIGLVVVIVVAIVVGAVLLRRRRSSAGTTGATAITDTPTVPPPPADAPMTDLEAALAKATARDGRPISEHIDAETQHVDELRVPDDTGPLLRRALDHVEHHHDDHHDDHHDAHHENHRDGHGEPGDDAG